MGRQKYGMGDWRAVREALAAGMTIRGAAAATGVNRGRVFEWSRMGEPPERMWLSMDTRPDEAPGRPVRSVRQRLDYKDRVIVFAMAREGAPHREIAEAVGCHRTTVSRELARAGGAPYDPRTAQREAERLARRPKARKLDADGPLRSYVVAGLLLKWSPEQISESIARDFPNEPEMRVSAETIYQAIYVQGRGSLRQELAVEQALRSGRGRRRPQSKLPKRARGSSWVEGCEIARRPKEAQGRAVPGHWEGDLVVGGDRRSCLVTLVERKTRFLVARRLATHDTRTVVDLLISMAQGIPDGVRGSLASTLTWDRGCELADAARFSLATGFKVYFCDPHSPWQKGTNENTNGLIRQYFPKGTRFTEVTDEEVQEMQDQMNGRPRKTLGWITPAEALAEELAAAERAMIA